MEHSIEKLQEPEVGKDLWENVSSGNIELLRFKTHSNCIACPRPAQDQASQYSNMKWRGLTSLLPPEELLWMRESVFIESVASGSSTMLYWMSPFL